MNQYKKTTKQSLEGEILIEIRKYHVSEIVKAFIKNNIIPKQYLDNLIKIKSIKKGILESPNIYTDEQRTEILEKLLQKECLKGTAKLITELCNLHIHKND